MQSSQDQNVVYASFWNDDEEGQNDQGKQENSHIDRTMSWMTCIYHDNRKDDCDDAKRNRNNTVDASNPMLSVNAPVSETKENVAPSSINNKNGHHGLKRPYDISAINELRDRMKRIPLAPLPLEDFPTKIIYNEHSPKKRIHVYDRSGEYAISGGLMTSPLFRKGKDRMFPAKRTQSSSLSYRTIFWNVSHFPIPLPFPFRIRIRYLYAIVSWNKYTYSSCVLVYICVSSMIE